MSLGIILTNITTICYLSRGELYMMVNDSSTSPALNLDVPDFTQDLGPYRFRLHFFNTESLISPTAVTLETDHEINTTTHYMDTSWTPDVYLKAVNMFDPLALSSLDNRFFSYSKLGYDVMLAEYNDLESSLCSNLSEVLLTSGPCWFTCYPYVTHQSMKRSLRRSPINLLTSSGEVVGIEEASNEPVTRDRNSLKHNRKYDEFEVQYYTYHLSPEITYTACTLYNPMSKRFLATGKRGKKYTMATMTPEQFHWNNIHRTKMADERFFIAEYVPGYRGTFIAFRSHENLGYYISSHKSISNIRRGTLSLKAAKPGQLKKYMHFQLTIATEGATTTPSPTGSRTPKGLINQTNRIQNPNRT